MCLCVVMVGQLCVAMVDELQARGGGVLGSAWHFEAAVSEAGRAGPGSLRVMLLEHCRSVAMEERRAARGWSGKTLRSKSKVSQARHNTQATDERREGGRLTG